MNAKHEMSFLGHLEVLRWHILRILAAIAGLAVIAFFFKNYIFDTILFGPKNTDFITYRFICQAIEYLGLTADTCIREIPLQIQSRTMSGQFSAHIWGAIFSGVVLGFPYAVYEIWRFVKPALHTSEKRSVASIVLASSGLFFIGLLFGYFIICPLSINFLGGYSVSSQVHNDIDLSSYVSLVISSSLGTGMIFELPVFTFYIVKMGLLGADDLKKFRKIAFVLILFLSAVITPPDLLSQVLVSGPLYLLYEISIVVASRIDKSLKLDEE